MEYALNDIRTFPAADVHLIELASLVSFAKPLTVVILLGNIKALD
jgi:hypothetical protein